MKFDKNAKKDTFVSRREEGVAKDECNCQTIQRKPIRYGGTERPMNPLDGETRWNGWTSIGGSSLPNRVHIYEYSRAL